jgi:hypothetical protein
MGKQANNIVAAESNAASAMTVMSMPRARKPQFPITPFLQ